MTGDQSTVGKHMIQSTKNVDRARGALVDSELPLMSNPYQSMARSNGQTMRQGGMFGTNNDLASLHIDN
jgi:hypothetical protein